MSLYSRRGVSAQKEEVHAATKDLNKGLYPFAFCNIFPDTLGGSNDWVNVMHADGAGTKSVLAYLYWKETGDVSVWKGIAQDAVVMNLDDLICTGIYDNILFSSTIDRNKALIPAEVLEALITGTQEVFDWLKQSGIHIHFLGGETADAGDVVRTVAVNGTMTARQEKNKLITNEGIKPGDVIIGVASYGQSSYETAYNSGIGSNGLTSARHDVLEKWYVNRFPESVAPELSDEVVYIGRHRLTDAFNVAVPAGVLTTTIGKLLLSPTRTYAPYVKMLLEAHFNSIHGMVHCSGGGQTKCLKYLPGPMRVVKDDLFAPPEIFAIIKEASNADDREMYQVFNMGHRLEIFTSQNDAASIISIAAQCGLEARVIGKIERSGQKELHLRGSFGEIIY